MKYNTGQCFSKSYSVQTCKSKRTNLLKDKNGNLAKCVSKYAQIFGRSTMEVPLRERNEQCIVLVSSTNEVRFGLRRGEAPAR